MPATSSRNYMPVVLGALVLLLIAGAYVAGQNRRAEQRRATPEQDVTAPVQVARSPANVVPGPNATDQDVVLQRQQMQKTLDASLQAVAARYANERTDPVWADAKVQKLAGFANSAPMREIHASVHDLQIDCRTTLCRITGDFPSRSAGDDWMTLFATGAGTEMARATYAIKPNTDGSVRIEVYAEGR